MIHCRVDEDNTFWSNLPMDLHLRPTLLSDARATEELTRDAFWDVYKPGADEHLVLRQLRASDAYLPSLDLVALAETQVVGHCITTRALLRHATEEQSVLCVGPISVDPARQRRGIGALLLRRTIDIATHMDPAVGGAALVLFGNPAYYRQFGFRPCRDFGITTSTGDAPDFLLVLPLRDTPLLAGSFHESPAFQVDSEELDRFEANFPVREKHVRPGQLPIP